jgi:hypothetical protein
MSTPHKNTKHGYARRGMKTPTYKAWESMFRRCTMKSQDSYEIYGGRGITVCEEWKSFETFLHDLGEKPDGYSLERIDVNKGYSKENCKWIPLRHQYWNKRTTRWIGFNGETKCLAEWAEIVGMDQRTLRARIVDSGMSIKDALTLPLQKKGTGSVNRMRTDKHLSADHLAEYAGNTRPAEYDQKLKLVRKE